METYVVGEYNKVSDSAVNQLKQLIQQTGELGYQFQEQGKRGYFAFRKLGHLESVITELVPICERIGLDVEDFSLKEYTAENHFNSATYINGRIVREHQPAGGNCR